MKKGKSKTQKPRKSRKYYSEFFLFPNFRFCPKAKIKNLDLKISEKNVRDF